MSRRDGRDGGLRTVRAGAAPPAGSSTGPGLTAARASGPNMKAGWP